MDKSSIKDINIHVSDRRLVSKSLAVLPGSFFLSVTSEHKNYSIEHRSGIKHARHGERPPKEKAYSAQGHHKEKGGEKILKKLKKIN